MSAPELLGVKPGPLAWMVRNRVTPNILMMVFIVGGLFFVAQIKQEVFPDFSEDIVNITVPYPGASPEEVERGIILVIEEAIRGIDGVKEVSASALEGQGAVRAELFEDVDQQKVYQDIKQEIDRITTFPEEAEEPEVVLEVHRHEVLIVELYGDMSEWSLREIAEQVRDRLLMDPGITQIEIEGGREYEVHIEVPQENLRAYGLTLDAIARKVGATSIELPGGKVETRAGEILLRVKERRDWAREFAPIPIVTTAEGTVVRLEDLATVRDTFEDTDSAGTYNGARAMGVAVYRVGAQTPIGVSDAVRRAMAEIAPDLPPRVHYTLRNDRSEVYRQRLELLLKNLFYGLLLVLLVLWPFLEARLAFWITMNIPISFLGAFLFLPLLGVTINMMSMFAFIVALGMVVDNGVVAGENIYEYRRRGMGFVEASIRGVRDVAMPVSFSVLTNIVSFVPLMFIPGITGKIWIAIPLVVIAVFAVSWGEALLVLPAHLAHGKEGGRTAAGQWLHVQQQRLSRAFVRGVERGYGPLLDHCLRARYLTIAVSVALLVVVGGYVWSGRIGMILMPKVEADYAFATAVLPVGSPFDRASAIRGRLERAANEVGAANGGERLLEGVFSLVRENVIEIRAYLTQPGIRPIGTAEFTRQWRDRVGQVLGLESLRYESDRGGPGSGASLTVELSHRNIDVLDRASADLAETLAGFPNVKDIDDGYTPGKQQLNFTLLPEGHGLGLTVVEVARQVRNAFYGAEALRQQRGRNEIKVKVRLPESERVSEYDIEELFIRTPAGRDVPLRQVVQVERGRAYTTITRREARRTVTVTANVEPLAETGKIQAVLNAEILPRLMRDYPGLAYSYEGRQADLRESMQSLVLGFVMALLGIYVLLAIPFGSYVQPLIVMVAIPFGIVGAVLGHLVMGYDLSVMSMMGIVALAGVIVNTSLVMIDYANRLRQAGTGPAGAISQAGIRRFRPILLTTLTTFGGLAPMIFETSRQARFMIPMALSLGYGILFGTFITLLLVPCLYMAVEDAQRLGRIFRRTVA
ncbi:MAG: efflux RND transporter permease subunit [Planctomycetes bacterium]|nr:efflux RND transporter permease subunit [Planctomycetota bacterium]